MKTRAEQWAEITLIVLGVLDGDDEKRAALQIAMSMLPNAQEAAALMVLERAGRKLSADQVGMRLGISRTAACNRLARLHKIGRVHRKRHGRGYLWSAPKPHNPTT